MKRNKDTHWIISSSHHVHVFNFTSPYKADKTEKGYRHYIYPESNNFLFKWFSKQPKTNFWCQKVLKVILSFRIFTCVHQMIRMGYLCLKLMFLNRFLFLRRIITGQLPGKYFLMDILELNFVIIRQKKVGVDEIKSSVVKMY